MGELIVPGLLSSHFEVAKDWSPLVWFGEVIAILLFFFKENWVMRKEIFVVEYLWEDGNTRGVQS